MAGANASTAGSSAAIPQLMVGAAAVQPQHLLAPSPSPSVCSWHTSPAQTPVERVVENLRQVAMLTTDFESSGQEALLGKMLVVERASHTPTHHLAAHTLLSRSDQVVQDMVLIDKLKDKCDASVPAELLE